MVSILRTLVGIGADPQNRLKTVVLQTVHAILTGTAIDIAGIAMPGLANVKVGSIAIDDLQPKPLKFDILALCPTLLPAAAAI